MRTLLPMAIVAAVVIAGPGFARAQTVSANSSHNVIVKPDGSAWAWGANASGQIGDGSTTRRDVPTAVSGLASDVIAVAAGGSHSLALKSDGTVWVWGANNNGQLGIGSTIQKTTPVEVTSLSNVVAIAAGSYHSLALTSDGSVWVWGANNSGQLGDGTTTQRTTPVQITSLSSVTSIASRANHTLALRSDGTVAAWGANGNGQLGDGTTTQRNAPVTVSSLTSVIQVSAGDHHSLALRSDGFAWSWGFNGGGQLGDATTVQRTTPVAVTNLGLVDAVAAGGGHSLALKADGSSWTWGLNGTGQLGDGTSNASSIPVTTADVSGIEAIAGGQSHSVFVSATGIVWAGGYNNSAQIGDGTRVTRFLPVKISEAGHEWKVGTPTFSVAPGAYTAIQNVLVASVTAGASVHYTLNGSTPTQSDPLLPANAIVTISETSTLKARAWKTGMPESNDDRADYVLRVATPTLSPGAGTYSQPQTVTVSCSVPGVTLRYTTNGSEPTEADPTITSGGTLNVQQTQTLKVRAWRSNWTTSDVATAGYTLKVAIPTVAPPAGHYESGQSVTIGSTSPDATLYYTLDGSEPSVGGQTISSGGAVQIGTSATLKVKGVRPAWTDSDIRVASYTFTLGAAGAPAFSPPQGTYTSAQTVQITSATAGVTIRYTTDGTEPTLRSRVYKAPLWIDKPAALKARAFKADWAPSATSEAVYDFDYGSVAIPVFSPAPGDFATARLVTVTTATSEATIRYTTNGAEPTESDPALASGGTVLIDRATRLRAKAFKTGMTESVTRTGDYWITGTVEAGDSYTLALKADGTLWAWGANAQGQLGDGTTTQRGFPVQVSGLSDVVALAAGTSHTLAVKSDGTVWAWGSNSNGQLAEATTTVRRLVPTQIASLSDVVQVAAGDSHSLALKRDGTVCAWGNNSSGQLGDGTTTRRTAPVCLAFGGVSTIAAGGSHTAAVKTDGSSSGTLWLWGSNSHGQLGDGSTVSQLSPIAIHTDVVDVGLGFDHSLAVLADASMAAWGRNTDGALGDGTKAEKRRPTILLGIDATLSVNGGRTFSLIRTADGSAWRSGESAGNPTIAPETVVPYRLPGLGITVVTAAAGGRHGVVARRDGSVWTWGFNTNNQLGDGTTTPAALPKMVAGLSLVDADWLMSDQDADGVPTWKELELGSDPLNPDTNGDGLRDGAAVNAGESPTSFDVDGDGLSNSVEREKGTDPFRADTDGDGVGDLTDAFPLDPTRSEGLTLIPGDTVPPAITLLLPANAVKFP